MQESHSFFCESCQTDMVFIRNSRERPGYNTLVLLSGGLWFFIWPLINRYFMEDEGWRCQKCGDYLVEELSGPSEPNDTSQKRVPKKRTKKEAGTPKNADLVVAILAILAVAAALLGAVWLWAF
jgi:hypothetical protein